eukprot:8204633-Pyramimonas_sp.AAC.1
MNQSLQVDATAKTVGIAVNGLEVPVVGGLFPASGLPPFGPELVLGGTRPSPLAPSALTGQASARRFDGLVYSLYVYRGASPASTGFASCTENAPAVAASLYPLNEAYGEALYDLGADAMGAEAGETPVLLWAVADVPDTLKYLQDYGSRAVTSGAEGGCLTFARMSQVRF